MKEREKIAIALSRLDRPIAEMRADGFPDLAICSAMFYAAGRVLRDAVGDTDDYTRFVIEVTEILLGNTQE